MKHRPLLLTARTRIRLVGATDASLLWHYRVENRDHLAPWEPLREETFYSPEHAAATISDGVRLVEADRAYPFVVLDRDEAAILATCTLSNVVRGSFQACHLGFGVAASSQGTGLMHEALQAALVWAFGELGLHRVMANYLPRNERSARLLARLGFEREGYAKRYLKIAGDWQDHVLTARIGPGG